MTDWTSIALTAEQKTAVLADKPEDMSNGEWLVALAEDGDVTTNGSVDADTVQEAVQEALSGVSVEASDAEKNASVLADRLMQRLKDIDEDVKRAAKDGAREAVEEAAR